MSLIQQFFLATSRTLVGVDSSEKGDENDEECEVLSGVEGISSFICCREEDVIASSKL
jgi:hypothetical protein